MFNYRISDANVIACDDACKSQCLHCQLIKERKSVMCVVDVVVVIRMHGNENVERHFLLLCFVSRRQYSVVLNIQLQYCAWRNNPTIRDFWIIQFRILAWIILCSICTMPDVHVCVCVYVCALSNSTTMMTSISALISISFSNRRGIIVNWYHCCCTAVHLNN